MPTGSDQQYRGLDAVSARVAWVGGSKGEVRRTLDGGRSWQVVSPPGSQGLLFRDVEATDAFKASVLSIGEGDASRIYTTFDGGRHWTTAFVNDDPRAFYDCMDFYAGGQRGLALSDPGRRQVPDRRNGRLGPQLARAAQRRHAARRRRRVRRSRPAGRAW